MGQTEKIRGRAAGKPPVPERLFFRFSSLWKKADFSMRYSSSVQTALHFFSYASERPSRSVIFPHGKRGH